MDRKMFVPQEIQKMTRTDHVETEPFLNSNLQMGT